LVAEIIKQKKSFSQQLKNIFSAARPIITSHHPLCEQFKNHTFRLFGRDFCIGCFIGYPVGFLTFLLIYLFNLPSLLVPYTFFIISVVFALIYVFISKFFTGSKKVKILSKFFIGIGSGFLLSSILTLDSPLWLRILIGFLIIQTIITILGLKRMRSIKKTCNLCEWKKDWKRCPGMKVIQEKLTSY
jgi:hypothetical protein